MVACGISGLFGGLFVVLPVADNSLMAAVPVFAFAVGFVFVVAFLATGFLLVVFLVAMILFSLKSFLLFYE
jgi:hypothetical protein